MLRSPVLFAIAIAFAVVAFVASPATSGPKPDLSTGPLPPVVCEKDKCTCSGAPSDCWAAFSQTKKCSEEAICTRPVDGSPDALANKWSCSCKTKSAKAAK